MSGGKISHIVVISDEQEKAETGKPVFDLIESAVNTALEAEGITRVCEVSVVFTDNNGIREYNREYRGADATTDVLSFPMLDEPYSDTSDLEKNPENGAVILGDIAISVERAIEQAFEIGQSPEREIVFLTVHSVLHLLGYDHESGGEEEERMLSRQRVIMEKLDIKKH